MRRRGLVMALLVGAGLAHFPLVYAILAYDGSPPVVALAAGLLAMGLAWAGGCAIEGRRPGSVRAIAVAGVLAGALPLVSQARDALGGRAMVWPVLGAALAALALVAILTGTPTARAAQR